MFNPSLYTEAVRQRKLLKSYLEISKSLGMSKGTLSYWFSKKGWSTDITKILVARNNKLNIARLKLARSARQNNIKKADNELKKEARKEYQKWRAKPLFVTGLSLYWGEGEKANRNRVALINTDPEMLKMVASFYRKYLKVDNKDLRIGLFLYKDLQETATVQFWARKLGVPKKQFIKIQFLESRSRLTQRKSKYGVCSLYFSNTRLSIKIREWLRLLSREVRE